MDGVCAPRDVAAPQRIAMAERFRVHDGAVCEIEAVIGAAM